jgi:Ca2+-binding RTX toxin-like protein
VATASTLAVVDADPASAAAGARPSASVAHNTLTITGTPGGDSIAIAVSTDNPNALLVDLGDGSQVQSFDRQTFNAITAFLGAGDDTFVGAFGLAAADDALTVEGDGGNDTITGGDGSDFLFGGSGNDTIDGRSGNDTIFGGNGSDVVDGNVGSDFEFLGAGRDTAVWNPGGGSDVVEGGSATDTMQFNGSNAPEITSLSANGNHAVFLRDVAAVRMDMNEVENFHYNALGSADSVTINDLSGTDLRQASVDLSSLGAPDGALDTVTVNGTNKADAIKVDGDAGAVDVTGLPAAVQLTGAEPTDQLQVNALGGNDSIAVSAAARALMTVSSDLGTGQR